MIGRLKFDIGPLVNEMLDQLPQELFESKVTTFLDPCMAGGQFVREIESRLRQAGHSDDNIASRVFGFETIALAVNYAVNKHGLVGQYQVCENFLELDMKKKFDCGLGNPPYSLAGNKTGKKGRAKNLYPQFYRQLVEMCDTVCMIVPNTSRQTTSTFNSYIRKNTNKIIPIDDNAFGINMSTWCLIRDGSGTNVDHIDWADLHVFPEPKVMWAKGKVNVTVDKHLLVDSGGEFTVIHKINGSGLHTSTTHAIPKNKLMPESGYAVVMPQQIQAAGWTDTAIIKCDGKQAATNGVNLAFVDTLEEAQYLVEYMKSCDFVEQAHKFCGGMNNMTLGAMKKIDMQEYKFHG